MQKNYVIASYLLFLFPLLLIVNFLLDIIGFEKVQGSPIFLPLLFCPIGLYFASKAYKTNKDVWTLSSIIANSFLFLFPFAYMIFGTMLFGV